MVVQVINPNSNYWIRQSLTRVCSERTSRAKLVRMHVRFSARIWNSLRDASTPAAVRRPLRADSVWFWILMIDTEIAPSRRITPDRMGDGAEQGLCTVHVAKCRWVGVAMVGYAKSAAESQPVTPVTIIG